MVTRTDPTWWRGARGEWYVIGQMVLLVLVIFGPRTMSGLPVWPAFISTGARVIAAVLMASGALLALTAVLWLGKNLKPLPVPRVDATLVTSGPYRLVRHPIYAGLILLSVGWAIAVNGWLTLVYAAALCLLLDFKSSREECWLGERFPTYSDYQRRVRKLVPYVY
jgi:protein-S-isoprenylcysteine O-methyltransferase Ste14